LFKLFLPAVTGLEEAGRGSAPCGFNVYFPTAEAAAAEVRDPGEAGEDAEGGQREGQADGAGEGGGRTGAPKNIYQKKTV
jgi:hypothetical protein